MFLFIFSSWRNFVTFFLAYHIYYAFQDAITQVASVNDSSLYRQLLQLPLSNHRLVEHPSSPSQPAATPTGYQTLPLELVGCISEFALPSSRLSLRLVNRASQMVVTQYTHTHLRLALPPNWQTTHTLEEIQRICRGQELGLATFSRIFSVGNRAICLTLTNWSLSNIAFFFTLFPRLKHLVIQGYNCTTANNPTILFPYLCPPHVKHLVLRHVKFQTVGKHAHSVEAMLSPGTCLASLELAGIVDGQTVSCFNYILPFTSDFSSTADFPPNAFVT